MELSNRTIERLKKELDIRYSKLVKEIEGVDFTNKKETPWAHCMDNERRSNNKFVNRFELSLALQDFNTILSEIKKLK